MDVASKKEEQEAEVMLPKSVVRLFLALVNRFAVGQRLFLCTERAASTNNLH